MNSPASSSPDARSPRLSYLTTDSLVDGVGASQVTPYLAELTRAGCRVTVHSFEPREIPERVAADIAALGITWVPHRFGVGGPLGGVGRLLRGAMAMRGARLVHARGTLPAVSALLSRPQAWVWDMRGLWTDARIAAGHIAPGSSTERVLRRLERRVALRADGIVTLTERAKQVLAEEFGSSVATKVEVIPTCVDLTRFAPRPMPPRPPLRLALSGTFGPRYNLEAVAALVAELRRRGPVELRALVPIHSARLADLQSIGARLEHPATSDIPAELSQEHVGLCILKPSRADAASMPTKIGEFLATGRPVVVSRDVGDLDQLLGHHRAGVVFDERDPDGIEVASAELLALLDDPELTTRCRQLAESRFDVRSGSRQLEHLYRGISGGGS